MTARAPAPPPLALEVDGRTVLLSRPDKVLFPATGFTKADVARYYLAVAPAILPHLAGRAVTLARFPDGVDAPGWYQIGCPPGRPAWLEVVVARGAKGQPLRYCRLESAAALAWAAGTGAIELHPLLARADGRDAADALVLDLDPRPPAGLVACARLALRLRERLRADGLAAWVKVSGGRGLHLHAPLAGAPPFAEVRRYARALAAAASAEDPGGVTDRLPLGARAGKVLVDWRQNAGARSLIAPWSLRAAAVPLVAAPLTWGELEAAAEGGDPAALRLGPAEALARLRERAGTESAMAPGCGR